MNHQRAIDRQRDRRRFRVRKRITGTAVRPRLSVFRSHKHIYAQLIDDEGGRTICSASSQDKDLRGNLSYGGNKAAAEVVGKAVAQRALEAGIQEISLDRGSYKYHGRLAALANAAREVGLKF
ncbi:MAG: 50S ribosomal protein L18 [Pirellulales bacterium]